MKLGPRAWQALIGSVIMSGGIGYAVSPGFGVASFGLSLYVTAWRGFPK